MIRTCDNQTSISCVICHTCNTILCFVKFLYLVNSGNVHCCLFLLSQISPPLMTSSRITRGGNSLLVEALSWYSLVNDIRSYNNSIWMSYWSRFVKGKEKRYDKFNPQIACWGLHFDGKFDHVSRRHQWKLCDDSHLKSNCLLYTESIRSFPSAQQKIAICLMTLSILQSVLKGCNTARSWPLLLLVLSHLAFYVCFWSKLSRLATTVEHRLNSIVVPWQFSPDPLDQHFFSKRNAKEQYLFLHLP